MQSSFNQSSIAIFPTDVHGKDVVAAFSLRTGGQSHAPFDSLNFSSRHGDCDENVKHNLDILSHHFGIESRKIVTCRQVHGSDVAEVKRIPAEAPQADALLTTNSDLYLGIKTADCLPIFLIDSDRHVVAAIHAGRTGTQQRITSKVLSLMIEKFACNSRNIAAVFGPCIGSCCYEIDQAAIEPFCASVPDAADYLGYKDNGKARLDLVKANMDELVSKGITPANIHVSGLCTACNPDLFFSYRRDGVRSGRHIAVVGFKK